MAEHFKGHGVDTSKDNSLSLTKDLTPWHIKLKNYLKSEGLWTTICIIWFASFFMSDVAEFLYLFAFFLAYKNINSVEKLPYKKPQTSGDKEDFNEVHPGTGKPDKPQGISFFGNEIGTKKEVWFTNSDVRTHCLIFGTTGAGKALKMNEKIHTPNGWVKNKDIKVGDTVSTPFGNSNVIGVYPQGKLDLYEIEFSDGRSMEVSGDHLWEVHYKNWKKIDLKDGTTGRAKVISTEDLLVELEKNNKNKNYYVELSGEVEKPKIELKIKPYLLGALLGDGNLTTRNLRFSTKDEEILNIVKEELPFDCELHKYNSNKKYNIIFKKDYVEKNNCYGRKPNGDYYQKSLYKELTNYNLIGKNSYNKFIPEDYKNSCLEDRYELIRGLMDTDGTAYKGRTEFGTSSEILANDLAELIRSVGGIANITKRYTTYTYKNEIKKGKIHYNVYIKHKNPKKLFSLTRKKEQVANYQYSETLKLKINSVKKINKKENCQCIKIEDPRGLFITKDYIVTHNTESLLSICVNSLNQASGFLYIDGKGDNGLWAKVFSLVAARGRLDDLYLINYMTSSVNLDRKTTERITNKMNPFATGNADSLTELIVSLLPDGGGDGMWKGRAAVFMGALLKALVYLRDEGKLLLDVDVVRKYFTLGEIVKLSRRTDIPKKYIDGIREYVRNLPGYIEPTPANPDPEQPESVAEQHGYITMQYTETFGLLADTYAHIMKTQVAEIDFYDIVVNRRILVVLLPALEKSKQSLSNLGRIIIASIKNMMSTTLGSKVEGVVEDVIETKPTNAPSPYLTIFDEYGYYATEGAAVMPAQARSLGFFMVFAGQDYQAFKKGSEEEAASIVANCAIKICMKLEDPTETLKIFQEAAGREKVVEQSSFEKNDQSLGGDSYMAAKSISVNEKDIINTRDLRDQNAGEAHMLFRDTTRRIKMFYAAPQPLRESRVNSFLEIEPPSYENVKLMKSGLNHMHKKFNEIIEDPKSYHKNIEKAMQHYASSELSSVFKLLSISKKIPSLPRSAFSIAGYIEKINIIDNKIVSDIRGNVEKFEEDNKPIDREEELTNNEEVRNKNSKTKVSDNKPKEPIKEREPVKQPVNLDDDIDSIFDNEADENINMTLKHVKNVLNEKYEELEDLENQDEYFDSFGKFEELGLEIFTIQNELNEAEMQLQNKLQEKVISDVENTIENQQVSTLAVENNIIDLGLNTNKVNKKPKKSKKEMEKELDDIISDYFD